jgi:hypothetical protein
MTKRAGGSRRSLAAGFKVSIDSLQCARAHKQLSQPQWSVIFSDRELSIE